MDMRGALCHYYDFLAARKHDKLEKLSDACVHTFFNENSFRQSVKTKDADYHLSFLVPRDNLPSSDV